MTQSNLSAKGLWVAILSLGPTGLTSDRRFLRSPGGQGRHPVVNDLAGGRYQENSGFSCVGLALAVVAKR